MNVLVKNALDSTDCQKYRNNLIELERELPMIYPFFVSDIDLAKEENRKFGYKLSQIQEEFNSLPQPAAENADLHRFVKNRIMDYLECYWDFAQTIRRGRVPGYFYIPQDINVKFNTNTSDDEIVSRHYGSAIVTGTHGNMPLVLGHLFKNRNGNVSSIEAGSYIPENRLNAAVFWDSETNAIDIVE